MNPLYIAKVAQELLTAIRELTAAVTHLTERLDKLP